MIDSRQPPPSTPGLANATAVRRALCQRVDAASKGRQTDVSPSCIRQQTRGGTPCPRLRRGKSSADAGKGDLDTPGG
jgi:hypothetical protein